MLLMGTLVCKRAQILCNLCNSANEPSFQNLTKRLFVGFWKDCLLAELQARMSKSRRFLLFLHHNYQVSLSKIHCITNDCNHDNVQRHRLTLRVSNVFIKQNAPFILIFLTRRVRLGQTLRI